MKADADYDNMIADIKNTLQHLEHHSKEGISVKFDDYMQDSIEAHGREMAAVNQMSLSPESLCWRSEIQQKPLLTISVFSKLVTL